MPAVGHYLTVAHFASAAMKSAIQIACFVPASLAWGINAYGDSDVYPANPAVVEDAVYVSAQGVTRFHSKTLKPVWQALSDVETLEPVATRRAILVGTTQGLYALDPTTGSELWHLAPDKTLFPPAVSGTVAFVGGIDGSLRAVRVDTGHALWRRDFGSWIYTPAVVDGRLVVGGKESVLRGIDANTGADLWQKPLDQELVYRPVEVPGGSAVATLFNGKILMVDAEDGTTRWQVQDQTPSFPPAVAGERLYFGTFDGSLKARSRQDGRIIWEQHMHGRLRFLPQVIDGVVLVASDQAEIGAYDMNTGTRLWNYLHSRELVASPVVLNNAVAVFANHTDPILQPVPFLSRSQP